MDRRGLLLRIQVRLVCLAFGVRTHVCPVCTRPRCRLSPVCRTPADQPVLYLADSSVERRDERDALLVCLHVASLGGDAIAEELSAMRLFVGNLSYNTAESSIQEMFEQFGTVDEVFLARDRETGRSRGFAFVTMNNDEEGQAAIEGTNGQSLDGRPLKVNEAQPREERGPRGGGGGFGGGGGGGRRGGGGGYGGGGGGGRGGYGGGGGGYGGGGGGRGGDRGGYDRGKRSY